MVQAAGATVSGLRVQDSGCRIWSWGFGVQVLGFRVQGSGSRVGFFRFRV